MGRSLITTDLRKWGGWGALNSWTDQSNQRALIAITIGASALRVTAALVTIDIPGDGPARAILAYRWAQSPRVITHGVWTPGLTYLAGLLCMIVPNARIAPRALNIILGSASVPLLYLVSQRLFGSAVALTAAAVLAAFPLHIGLSASSLSEVPFLCVLLALLCVAFAQNLGAQRPALWIATLAVLGVLLEMLRYEAWLLLPLVVAYVAYRRRSVAIGIGLIIAWLPFPLLWSLQSQLFLGDALYGFKAAVNEEGAPVPALMAIRLQWRMVRNHLGALATMIMVAGGLAAALSVARRAATAEQRLYVGLTAIAWIILFGVTLRRGGVVWGRYYLVALTLTFPLAAVWLHRWIRDRRIAAAVAGLCVVFFAASYFTYRPTMFVSGRRFPDIHALIAWRAGSIYKGDAVLLTPLNWEATYVAFYAPDLAGRSFIVAPVFRAADFREFYHWQRPRLLITRPEDTVFVRRVEQQFGCAIGPEHRVATVGQLQVFDIRHLEACTQTGQDTSAR